MRKHVYIISFGIVFVLVIIAGSSLGAKDTGTTTLLKGQFLEFQIPFNSGQRVDISYSVEVTDGPPIDVFLLNEEGYSDYTRPLSLGFAYYEDASYLNTRNAEAKGALDQRGNYYIIFDNTERATRPPANDADASAILSYTVEYNIGLINPETMCTSTWLIIIILVIIIVVSLGFVAMKSSKKDTVNYQQALDSAGYPQWTTGSYDNQSGQYIVSPGSGEFPSSNQAQSNYRGEQYSQPGYYSTNPYPPTQSNGQPLNLNSQGHFTNNTIPEPLPTHSDQGAIPTLSMRQVTPPDSRLHQNVQVSNRAAIERPQYCLNCGTKLMDEAEFCISCGGRVL